MTEKDILNMVRSGERVLLICMSARQPLAPGARRGYFCTTCVSEIQILPQGREKVRAGAIALCPDCGMKIVEARAKLQNPSTIVFGETATEQLEKAAAAGDENAADILRAAKRELEP
jgi:DNA-directed RNA polymerase subunit RPC12/RpoP